MSRTLCILYHAEMNEAKKRLTGQARYGSPTKPWRAFGVRNVAGFNQKLAACKNDLPPDFADLEPWARLCRY